MGPTKREARRRGKREARQYRGFRGTERNRMGRRIRRNDTRRPVPKFHEGGPAGFSCSVRVPRSARASFLVSFTRSFFRPGIRAGITDIPFIRFAWILAFNNTEWKLAAILLVYTRPTIKYRVWIGWEIGSNFRENLESRIFLVLFDSITMNSFGLVY